MSAAAKACPSAQPDMEDAQVLGVLERCERGTELAYVAGTVPVSRQLLETTGPVPPEVVFRFAARCVERKCTHFDGQDCQLAKRIVAGMEASTDRLPPCSIRKTCRWYGQEGAPACHRCPQIATRIEAPEPEVMAIAGLAK